MTAGDDTTFHPHEVLAEDVEGFLFWRAALRWQRAITAALKPMELTPAQYVLLSCARRFEMHGNGRPTQRQLADLAGTDTVMTSTVVGTLVKRGLLAKHADPSDRRVWRIEVTEEGIALAASAAAVALEADVRFFEPVGPRGSMLEELRLLADWTPPTP